MNNDIYSVYGDFLSGKMLDVGRRFQDLSMPMIVDRTEYLRRRCMHKKCLHIGCLDHPEIIPDRLKNGTWLHGILSDVSEYCVGIDVDFRAYDLVCNKLGFDNIELLDLSESLDEKDISRLRKNNWDLILCPEIVEHITCHKQFFQNLRLLSDIETTLIITGPNAFQFMNFVNALRGFEAVNSDHKYWFSFYTLCCMLAANGWKPRQLIYYNGTLTWFRWKDILYQIFTRISRVFCHGLIIEATYLDCK